MLQVENVAVGAPFDDASPSAESIAANPNDSPVENIKNEEKSVERKIVKRKNYRASPNRRGKFFAKGIKSAAD